MHSLFVTTRTVYATEHIITEVFSLGSFKCYALYIIIIYTCPINMMPTVLERQSICKALKFVVSSLSTHACVYVLFC